MGGVGVLAVESLMLDNLYLLQTTRLIFYSMPIMMTCDVSCDASEPLCIICLSFLISSTPLYF